MTANNRAKRKPITKQIFAVDFGRLMDKELYHRTTVDDPNETFMKTFVRDPWSEVILKLTIDYLTGDVETEVVKFSDRREEKYRNVGE